MPKLPRRLLRSTRRQLAAQLAAQPAPEGAVPLPEQDWTPERLRRALVAASAQDAAQEAQPARRVRRLRKTLALAAALKVRVRVTVD